VSDRIRKESIRQDMDMAVNRIMACEQYADTELAELLPIQREMLARLMRGESADG
jgi:hypothetical protein